MHESYGDERFARLASASNCHIHNLRKTRAHRTGRLTFRKTRTPRVPTLMAVPACANDVGGQCTLRRPDRAHLPSPESRFAPMICALPTAVAGAAALVWAGLGATRQSEGLLRVRDRVALHIPAPYPRVAPRPAIPWREGGSSAASRRRTTRSSTGRPSSAPASPRKFWDAPVTGSPWPSRTGLLDGRDPAATGRMGLSGSILSDAKRGLAERGVSPIHVKGTRIGIGAPPTVAQLPTRQRFA